MSLDEGQIKHSGIKAFKDPKGFAAFTEPATPEQAFDIPAVALVDEQGQQTGTAGAPLAVSSEAMDDIRVQLRIMNLHLAHISGEKFTAEDVEL